MGCGHSEPATIEPLDNDYQVRIPHYTKIRILKCIQQKSIHLKPSLISNETEAEEQNILNEAYEAILELGVLDEFQVDFFLIRYISWFSVSKDIAAP